MLFFLDVLPGSMLSPACQRVVQISISAVVVVTLSGVCHQLHPSRCSIAWTCVFYPFLLLFMFYTACQIYFLASFFRIAHLRIKISMNYDDFRNWK